VFICLVISIPSGPGIWRSSKTRSTALCARRKRAASPQPASPAISISGMVSRNKRTPCRNKGWSSTINNLIFAPLMAKSHLDQAIEDLPYIHAMVIVVSVIMVDRRVQEVPWFQILKIDLPAFHHQVCFLKIYPAYSSGDGREAGRRRFIYFPAGPGPAKLKDIPVFFSKSGEGKDGIFLHQVVGIPLWSDETEAYRFSPKDAKPSPTGCHHIEFLRGTGGNKQPVLVE